jgi:hypothetical protein
MINHWQEKTIPYSWYLKNTTEDWSGSDQFPAKNPAWQNAITYKFSNEGFRTHNFADVGTQKINIALGCSHTMGIGISYEMTWPYHIENQTGIKTLNLGLGQGSSDTVARILTNVCGIFDINTVYILWPTSNRFEIYHENSIESIIPSSAELQHVWYIDDCNSFQRLCKNKHIVYNLQKMFKFNLEEIESNSRWAVPGDLARDQLHNGPKSNLNLSNLFLTGAK